MRMQRSSRLQIEGKWDEFKGRVQAAYGELTDDDVRRAEGDVDRLAGIIKQRTGDSLEAIHERLDELAAKAQERFNEARH